MYTMVIGLFCRSVLFCVVTVGHRQVHYTQFEQSKHT